MDRRRFLHLTAAVGLFGGSALRNLAHAATATGTSLDNMLSVHATEAADKGWFDACAVAADKEGYAKAAQLFRAMSASAKIHADRLAETITKAGGKTKDPAAAPAVGTTKENLEAALRRETAERKVTYTGFVMAARKEKNKDALRALNFAAATIDPRAKYYKEAIDGMEAFRQAGKGLWVCGVCGYVVTKIDFVRCLICFNPKEKYFQVA